MSVCLSACLLQMRSQQVKQKHKMSECASCYPLYYISRAFGHFVLPLSFPLPLPLPCLLFVTLSEVDLGPSAEEKDTPPMKYVALCVTNLPLV